MNSFLHSQYCNLKTKQQKNTHFVEYYSECLSKHFFVRYLRFVIFFIIFLIILVIFAFESVSLLDICDCDICNIFLCKGFFVGYSRFSHHRRRSRDHSHLTGSHTVVQGSTTTFGYSAM